MPLFPPHDPDGLLPPEFWADVARLDLLSRLGAADDDPEVVATKLRIDAVIDATTAEQDAVIVRHAIAALGHDASAN